MVTIMADMDMEVLTMDMVDMAMIVMNMDILYMAMVTVDMDLPGESNIIFC